MAETPPKPSNRPVYSCIRCSDRKIKCDREHPSCGACKKHNVPCTYRPPRKPQKKLRRLKREVLIDQLQHYETFLKDKGLEVDEIPNRDVVRPDGCNTEGSPQAETSSQLQTPSSLTSEPSLASSKKRMFSERGQVRFVDNSLMTRVAEEFDDAKQDFIDSSHEESLEEEPEEGLDLFLGSFSRHRSRYKHPPAEEIYELWEIFVERVDPLTKIVHVPSLRVALKKATKNLETIPRSFNALMVGIYSTAILSLNEKECQNHFAQARSKLLSHHVAATKEALARADFTKSENIIVLQALIFHILSIRDTCDAREMWVLTGVAKRIAEAIGLYRDPHKLGFAPFEAEIRRRVWFYLNMHDNRAAEMCGQPKFQGLDRDANLSKALANVNDDDIFPGMSNTPTESSGPTDMIFCAVQSEFFVWAGRMASMNRKTMGPDFSNDDFASKESVMPDKDTIQSMEDNVEAKYLRHCDPSDPLQLMTILFSRYCINVGRFMSHHPGKWQSRGQMPEEERKYVWDISIKLLEEFDMMQSSQHLQKFAWNFSSYLQWWAFIHILDTLRIDPFIPDANKAWRLVETTFHNNPRMITDTKRPLYVAIGNLCLKAFATRKTTTTKEKSLASRIPDFIHKLRQQRENPKTQKQFNFSAWTEQEPLLSDTDAAEGVTKFVTGTPHDHLGFHQDASDNASSQWPTRAEENIPLETDGSTYWLTDDLKGSGFPGTDNVMDMSTSFTFTHDPSLNDATMQAIDWTQWETWLSGTGFRNVDIPWTVDAI